MDIFSHFCNICWNNNAKNLKNICESNMEQLKNTLITFIGHGEFINNTLYLCQSCCETIIHFNKFRSMCLSNLVELRQLYLKKISMLELTEKLLFVEEAVAKNTGTDSVSTNVQEFLRKYSDFNQIETTAKTQILNVHAGANESEINNSENVLAKDELQTNEAPKSRSEQLKFELLEYESGEEVNLDFDSEIELSKEPHDENETEDSISEGLDLEKLNYCSDDANLSLASEVDIKFDLDVPAVDNSNENDYPEMKLENKVRVKEEINTSAALEMEKNDDSHVMFQVANVCTVLNMEDYADGHIRNEENVPIELQLRSGTCNNKAITALMNAQPISSTVCEYDNGWSRTAMQSGRHERVYPDTEPHIMTPLRNQLFRTSSCLIRHERGDNPYKCTFCSKTFTYSSSLVRHTRIHTGDRPYICMICNKDFTESSGLTDHVRIHTGERPYKCTVCNKAFIQSSALTIHKRTHSGEKPYKCNECNKMFASPTSLYVHKRVHTGEKPYKCPLCIKTFSRSSILTVHKRIHSGERPYKCDVCNKGYIDQSGLRKHKCGHSGDRP